MNLDTTAQADCVHRACSPVRITLSRRKGWRMPKNTVKVCRPTKWGNPFVVGKDGDAQQCVKLYECLTADWRTEQAESLAELSGKNLACWCNIMDETGNYVPCHADILLALANGMTQEEVHDENVKAHKRRMEYPYRI